MDTLSWQDEERLVIDAAARGAEWLDGALPEWHQHVDPDTLRMEDSTWCVGGQICRGMGWPHHVTPFNTFCMRMRLSATGRVRLGLVLVGTLTYGNICWDMLTKAWAREIRARRG